MNETIPIACDITVLPPSAQEQTAITLPDLLQSVQDIQKLPTGYAFQFPNKPGMWLALAQFIDRERQCCPFLHFTLKAKPNNSPFWLHMTGDEGVKQFLETFWHDLPESPAVFKKIGE